MTSFDHWFAAIAVAVGVLFWRAYRAHRYLMELLCALPQGSKQRLGLLDTTPSAARGVGPIRQMHDHSAKNRTTIRLLLWGLPPDIAATDTAKRALFALRAHVVASILFFAVLALPRMGVAVFVFGMSFVILGHLLLFRPTRWLAPEETP